MVERPGGWLAPGSLRGLDWLCRVGPAPVQAWGCALGWSRSAGFRHAQRLVAQGWVTRLATVWGHGSLLVPTRAGVRMSGLPVTAALEPAPTWWAHLQACAWTAAWMTVRGRPMLGCREIDADSSWSGVLRWRDNKGSHQAGHRPDLVWAPEGGRAAIEVELARKSTPRLDAVLGLHAGWRAAGKTGGVIYVCADQTGCERVRRVAVKHGLSPEPGGGLRVETLAHVKAQALKAHARRGENPAGQEESPELDAALPEQSAVIPAASAPPGEADESAAIDRPSQDRDQEQEQPLEPSVWRPEAPEPQPAAQPPGVETPEAAAARERRYREIMGYPEPKRRRWRR